MRHRVDDEVFLEATQRRMPKLTFKVGALILLGLSSTCGVCAYSAFCIKWNEEDFEQVQRSQHRATINRLMNSVQRQLETSVSSTRALAALVQLDQGSVLIQPLGAEVQELRASTADVASKSTAVPAEKNAANARKAQAAWNVFTNASLFNYNHVADSLINTYKGISNLQLAPGGVVSVIHPIIGNEGAIGHDLFYDAARRDDAIKSIMSNRVTFVGPLTLIQSGKTAIIARFPVFITTSRYIGPVPEYPTWWGFTTMLCTLDDFFRATPLVESSVYQASYVLYALTANGEQLLRTSGDVPADWKAYADAMKPVYTDFFLKDLNVHWCMKSWPSDGWLKHSNMYGLQVALCVCFTFMSLMSVYGVALREAVISEVASILGRSISSKNTLVMDEKSLCITPHQNANSALKHIS